MKTAAVPLSWNVASDTPERRGCTGGGNGRRPIDAKRERVMNPGCLMQARSASAPMVPVDFPFATLVLQVRILPCAILTGYPAVSGNPGERHTGASCR